MEHDVITILDNNEDQSLEILHHENNVPINLWDNIKENALWATTFSTKLVQSAFNFTDNTIISLFGITINPINMYVFQDGLSSVIYRTIMAGKVGSFKAINGYHEMMSFPSKGIPAQGSMSDSDYKKFISSYTYSSIYENNMTRKYNANMNELAYYDNVSYFLFAKSAQICFFPIAVSIASILSAGYMVQKLASPYSGPEVDLIDSSRHLIKAYDLCNNFMFSKSKLFSWWFSNRVTHEEFGQMVSRLDNLLEMKRKEALNIPENVLLANDIRFNLTFINKLTKCLNDYVYQKEYIFTDWYGKSDIKDLLYIRNFETMYHFISWKHPLFKLVQKKDVSVEEDFFGIDSNFFKSASEPFVDLGSKIFNLIGDLTELEYYGEI